MATIDSSALDELNSPETRALFDTFDRLSSLGVGRIVDLPQIIVVGDQSSGKSSVLEAISHVHFPVEGDVCTRFATELVLRPSTRPSITATVRFANATSSPHSLQVADFKQEDIHEIINDAKEKMGISGNTNKGFSKDVLRLEIEGPDLYPLSLVDLPGIFHSPTAKQSVEDIKTVDDLVASYMQRPNSIILTIISANSNLANQAVMRQATRHDPSKTRTLGVVTKPDLLPPGSGSENDYLRLVRGREPMYNLALGWHVLRNKADYEQNTGSRETVENEFFASGAWASIAKTNRGITSLRTKLSRVLLEHIKRGLPALLEDLQNRLSEKTVELNRLGEPRDSPGDMRSYLTDIASEFERLAYDGIQGRYNNPFFHSPIGSHQRLRAHLRNFSKALRFVSLKYGCSMEIVGQPGQSRARTSEAPTYLGAFLDAHKYSDGLRRPNRVTWKQLNSLLEQQAAAQQGTEFPGYANMDIVIRFFQDQAEPWQNIAEKHLEKVISVVKAFVEAVFEHIAGSFDSSSTTRAILFSVVDVYFDDKEKALAEKLKEILRPYKNGFALPLDADFHEAMEKRVAERAAANEEPMPSTGSEFGTERIIDTVQTFYEMALRTFTDNVINLAVESCLVQDLPKIFTPRQVSNMSDSKLKELADESPEARAVRSELKADIELLEAGLERCRPYKPRAVPSVLAPAAGETAQEDGEPSSRRQRSVVVEPPSSASPSSKETEPVSHTARSPMTPATQASATPHSSKVAADSPSFSFNTPLPNNGHSPFHPSASSSGTAPRTPQTNPRSQTQFATSAPPAASNGQSGPFTSWSSATSPFATLGSGSSSGSSGSSSSGYSIFGNNSTAATTPTSNRRAEHADGLSLSGLGETLPDLSSAAAVPARGKRSGTPKSSNPVYTR